VDRVLVVLGHRSPEIAANLEGSGAQVLDNPRYLEGMLTSVQAGVAAAPADAEWLVIALGDQPSLQAETVRQLLATAEAEDAGIVVPSYSGRRGHPLVIHTRYRDEIAALDPSVGLRELMQRHPEAIRHVVFPDESVLHDMDTPEDYARALQRLQPPGA